jgi:formylmethanofuran dehydrogenase subunit E
MKHATIEKDGYKVPLIGIPPDAVLQECDLCHDLFPLREVEVTDAGVLCEKCRRKV